jgi:hypothetical protein
VYHIRFLARTSQGSCDGEVLVCVPHDLDDQACVDDGALYDSTHRGGGGNPQPALKAETDRDSIVR